MWRDADFRRLWRGQTTSQLGEHTSLVILPLLAVLTLGVSAGDLGLLRAVGQAPQLLLTLPAGGWVDRRPARTLMVLADAARALTLGCAAVAVLAGLLGLPALLAVAFAVGALSVLFDVAYQASLPRLVDRAHLLGASSALEGSRSVAQLGGPALGGTLVSLTLTPAPVAVAAGALLFTASAGSLARIRRRETPLSSGGPRGIGPGLRFVARRPALRTICLASAAFQGCFAALMTAYLLFLPRDLHLSGATVGLVLAATGPGAVLGALLAARLPGRFGYGPTLVAAAVLGDGALLCVPALPADTPLTVVVLAAANLLLGAGGQLVNVITMTVRQAVTPPALLGRVTATISFAGMGVTPIGSLLGGLLAQQAGVRTALLVTAAGLLLSPLLMALSPLARLGRDLPAS